LFKFTQKNTHMVEAAIMEQTWF